MIRTLLICLLLPTAAHAQAGPLVLTSPAPGSFATFGASVAALSTGVVVVGEPGATATEDRAGRAYVLSGTDGMVLRTLAQPTPTFAAAFGQTVVALGDVDGDGLDEVAVAAPGDLDPAPSVGESGRVYVFSAAPGVLLYTFTAPQPVNQGRFGQRMASVDDVDGDGARDLAVLDRRDNRVRLFNGRTGALIRALAGPPASPVAAIAGVPDLDGDGAGDVLVGNNGDTFDGSPDPGSASVFSGATGVLLARLVSPATQPADYFGAAVAGVPDVDGDGAGDLLVGAPLSPVGEFVGRAFVFSGATRALLFSLVSPTPNPSRDFDFGRVVAAGPDLTGDGTPDLLVAAPFEGADRFGRVHVFSGANGALAGTLASSAPTAGVSGQFGGALALRPNRPDVIVGAPFERVGSVSAGGHVYILRSAFTSTTAAPDDGALSVMVWPNPVAGHLHARVTGTADARAEARIVLLDPLGRSVADAPTAGGIDTSGLSPGVYMWRVTAGARARSGRVTVLGARPSR